VPELQEININLRFDLWTATPMLASLFSRCSIQTFSISSPHASGYYPSDNDMVQLLQACPALVKLELRGRSSQCLTKSFLTQFAFHCGSEDSAAPRLVPMLRSMMVDSISSHFDILHFADAIQPRMASNVLRAVEIRAESYDNFSPDERSRLRQLEVWGDVRVSGWNRDPGGSS